MTKILKPNQEEEKLEIERILKKSGIVGEATIFAEVLSEADLRFKLINQELFLKYEFIGIIYNQLLIETDPKYVDAILDIKDKFSILLSVLFPLR